MAQQESQIQFEPASIDFEPIRFEPVTSDTTTETTTTTEKPKKRSMLERLLFGPTSEEIGLPEGGRILGTPESEGSILPSIRGSADTRAATGSNVLPPFWEGFLESLYEDIVRPFGSPSGVMGMSSPVKAPIKAPTKAPVKQQLLLPEGRGPGLETDPFIASPTGRVQKKSLITPQEEARLAGYDIGEQGPIGKPGEPVKLPVDLNEVRERTRLEEVFFTGHEQGGGTALVLPDRPTIELPPVAGERGLGFESVSRSNLEYPLNVVPESVRPRSAQTVTRALAGDVKPIKATEPITFESVTPVKEKPVPPKRDLRGGTAAIDYGNEPILPSAQKIKAAADNTGTKPEVLATASNLAPEPVKQAVRQVIEEESSRPSMWKSVYHQVKELSPELYTRAFRSVQTERQLRAQWAPAFQSAINKLSKIEKENFGAYVEGAAPITSPKVQAAVDIWKQVENQIGDEATRSGVRLFTDSKNWVPFQKNPNYWPHVPVERLSREDLVGRLIKNGMSRSEANRVAAHYRKTGELKVSAQYARVPNADIPYKLDADTGMQHIRNMSKRIAQTKEFGPLDVKGKGVEGISDLIEGSANPKLANQLMERIIGRDVKDDRELLRILKTARKYSTITKLQNFTIPNVILGNMSTAVRNVRHPYEAVKEVSKLFTKKYRDEIRASGAVEDFAISISEEIKPGRDWFGIGAGETFNRSIAAATGRSMARSSFKDLKINPNDKFARKELFELLGEDVDKILQQESLTNEQLRFAAGRMAERTQGLNVPGNLPYFASQPVSGPLELFNQMFWIFKKMGYQATRNLWDQVKTDPIRTIPAWMAAAGLGGELVGDSKAFLKGIWKGDPAEELNVRGSFWLENAGIPQSAINKVSETSGIPPELVARLFDNYMQAFWLGLPADILMSTAYGPAGLAQTLVGPVITDISKLGGKVMDANWKGIGKDIVRSFPIPGSAGLSERIFED